MARQSTQHVSLQPIEKRALEVLADRLERGNRSQFVARLIVKAAREEIGKDWERVVTGAAPTKEEHAA